MTTMPTDDHLADAGLRLEIRDAVATITLNRPESRNAQTPAMWRALAAIGAALSDEVRVVVLRGEGPCFSAGLDLGLIDPKSAGQADSLITLMQADDQTISDTVGDYQSGFTWLRDPRFITIAAVHGPAVGAGFQLALACDLRVVAEDTRFCMKEPALGLVPDLTGTKPLVEIVGYSRALEMCVTARFVGAAEALETGIATAVVPTGELVDSVRDLTDALLANPVGAVRGTKALLQQAWQNTLDEQRLVEREAQVSRFRELSSR